MPWLTCSSVDADRQGQGHLGHDGSVTAAAASPDGRYFATSAADYTVIIWSGMESLETILVEIHLPGGGVPVNALAFSDAGDFLAAVKDASLLVWRLADGSLISSFEISRHEPSWIKAACFSPCERYVATASVDHTVRLWSIGDGSLMWTFVNHDATVSHVVFSADGKTLVSADKSGRVCVHALCMFVRDAPLCLG
ncbi:WD40-repeat-containing domain protein [Cerioporus squamosus]|nr:WD40-repeat-containing domain protein [Cerioporus squamosus]